MLGFLAALLLPATGIGQVDGKPVPASSTLQRQLRHTQSELQRQHAQTDQLRAQVNDLEKRSAANRAQLDQRDREIEELKRKLAALPAPAHSAPVPPSGH